MKITTKMLTINGLIVALFLIFTFVPSLGYITIGPIQLTLMHLWFLIGMQTLFVTFNCRLWIAGLVYGFIFGLSSWIQAIIYPSITSFIFINPLFSIVPRLLMGIVVGLIAQLVDFFHQNYLQKQQQKYRNVVAYYLRVDQTLVAFSAATFNTFFVLGFLRFIGPLLYQQPNQIAIFHAIGFFILLTNYLPEVVIAILIFPVAARVLQRIKF